MGGEYDDSDAVKITGIPMVRIPVSDLERSVEFYTEVLNLKAEPVEGDRCLLQCGGQKILLERRPHVRGGDTGVFLSTPSIYDVQKRLADMPVTILQPPIRGKDGLTAVIADDDGNVINLLEE